MERASGPSGLLFGPPLGTRVHDWLLVDHLKINPRVDAELSALLVRMLSVSPTARGSAGELAEALEAAAERVEKETGGSRVGKEDPAPSRESWSIRSAWALAGALLVLWALKAVHAPSHSAAVQEPVASSGPTNLGETAPQTPPPPEQDASPPKTISQEPPPEPFPGQLTPDAKGRCPGPKQIPLNGGCWVEYPSKDAEECEKNGLVFTKGRCYAPSMGSRRKPPPTSAPSDSR